MIANLNDVQSSWISITGATTGSEVGFVTSPCWFRGLTMTVKETSTSTNDFVLKIQLLNGSTASGLGTPIIQFGVPFTFNIFNWTNKSQINLMLPDEGYVRFSDSIWIKTPDDGAGLNLVDYCIFYNLTGEASTSE